MRLVRTAIVFGKSFHGLYRQYTARFSSAPTTITEPFTVPLMEELDFNNADFSLPELNAMPLEMQHGHPKDELLQFNEKAHKYSYEGVPMKMSVTSAIDLFFKKFDSDVIIAKMMKGRNWPRPEYTHDNGEPFTAEEIKDAWSANGLEARNRGTYMHYNIEQHVNGLTSANYTFPEMSQFMKFYKKHIIDKGIQPYRSEWRIAAPDFSLAGSVDFVGLNPDGTYTIADWKRAKDLENNLKTNFKEYATSPLKHLDDCAGTKYTLQLNMYRYMLEKYYGIKVTNLLLASFHPNLTRCFAVRVPLWDKETQDVMDVIMKKTSSGE